MSAGRSPARLAAALAVLLAAGCAAPAPRVPLAALGVMPGRLLVVARAVNPDDHAVAERAADLLAARLRPGLPVVTAREFLAEAAGSDTPLWTSRVLFRLQAGLLPTPDEGAELLARHAISALLGVEVPIYEQVWGRYAKFTRAAVDVQAVSLPSGQPGWRLHAEAEVEAHRGRAFEYALELAVSDLARSIEPRARSWPAEAWRMWRR